MNTWYHVAVSASNGGTAKIYLNGLEVKSQPAGNTGKWLEKMTLGDLREDRGLLYRGWLDDVRIWNVIRTPAEILANYDKPISNTGDLVNLIGYWKLDETEGNNAQNSSQYGDAYDGTVDNGNWAQGNETLPVELSGFFATITAQNFVRLSWATQTETGVLGYVVYRSANEKLNDAIIVSPLINATNSSEMQLYVYEDKEVSEGIWHYWLQSLDLDGSFKFHGPIVAGIGNHGAEQTPDIPVINGISRVYPNPFNPDSNISFALAKKSNVKFKVYNTRGQMVQSFDLGEKAAGNHVLTWNAGSLSSGVYIIHMDANGEVHQAKAVLSK